MYIHTSISLTGIYLFQQKLPAIVDTFHWQFGQPDKVLVRIISVVKITGSEEYTPFASVKEFSWAIALLTGSDMDDRLDINTRPLSPEKHIPDFSH